MHINSDMSCCGIREIVNLHFVREPKAAMRCFWTDIQPRPNSYNPNLPPYRRDKFRYVIFSAHRKGSYGPNFAAYILEHKLGKVISTGNHINPNTRNSVNVWVWTVNHEKLAKWAAVHVLPVAKQVGG